MHVQVMSATTMIGDEVENTAGEVLGEMVEIMIDLDNCQVPYAPLSTVHLGFRWAVLVAHSR